MKRVGAGAGPGVHTFAGWRRFSDAICRPVESEDLGRVVGKGLSIPVGEYVGRTFVRPELQERIALGLPRGPITDQLDTDQLSCDHENVEQVALVHPVRQVAQPQRSLGLLAAEGLRHLDQQLNLPKT